MREIETFQRAIRRAKETLHTSHPGREGRVRKLLVKLLKEIARLELLLGDARLKETRVQISRAAARRGMVWRRTDDQTILRQQ